MPVRASRAVPKVRRVEGSTPGDAGEAEQAPGERDGMKKKPTSSLKLLLPSFRNPQICFKKEWGGWSLCCFFFFLPPLFLPAHRTSPHRRTHRSLSLSFNTHQGQRATPTACIHQQQ
jgi:hypothetical protein